MAHHLSVKLRDHRKRERPGTPQCLDDELFGLMTEGVIFEGSDGDGVYCINICREFRSDDHFGTLYFFHDIFVVDRDWLCFVLIYLQDFHFIKDLLK